MSASGRKNPVIRLFASVWFGISMLALVLVYASVLSAVPSVRAAMEMSEMQAFQHWIFVALIVLFAISLSIATWTRIRWNIVNAGVLMVHSGLLLLTLGSVAYFGTKIEGDVVLITPRVEILTSQGDPIRGAELKAVTGEVWQQNMPAFGGQIRVEVLEAEASDANPIQSARLKVNIGSEPPRLIDLDADRQPFRRVGNMITRLVTPPAQNQFFVDEDPVLFYKGDDERMHYTVLHGLPMHRERYLSETEPLVDRDANPIESKRTYPHAKLAGLEIPTGWLEPWHLPVEPATPNLPDFDVKITGYVPYIAGMASKLTDGGDEPRPGLQFSIVFGNEKVTRWLVPGSPSESLLQTSIPIEMHWITDPAQLEAIIAPPVGPHELVVEVKNPPVRKVYAIEEGQTIDVEGTPYRLDIKRFTAGWPMMSPGFEGAVSPVASVDVDNGKLKYNRTVIQRYPQLSQDIDERGVRHTEGPYDGNLKLWYRTVATGWMHFVAGPEQPLEAIIFAPDGSMSRTPLPIGEATLLNLPGFPLKIQPEQLAQSVREIRMPILEPLATRRPNVAIRSMSAIKLELTGKGEHAGWSEERWMRFSSYPQVDAFPIEVKLPNGKVWELTYSRRPESIGADLIPQSLSVTFFPGRNSVESWRSDFLVKEEGGTRGAAVYTNQTANVGKWTLFQSGADPDHWRYTVIGIGSRAGIWPMSLGCVLITIGCLYAFYVKPVLKRRKRAEILAASKAALERKEASAAEAPELSEVTS